MSYAMSEAHTRTRDDTRTRDRDSDRGERSLQSDLRRLRERGAAVSRDAARVVESAVRAEPWLATTAALGVGFLLGGGLTPKVRMLLVGAGSRYLGAWLSEEVMARSGAGSDGSSDGESE